MTAPMPMPATFFRKTAALALTLMCALTPFAQTSRAFADNDNAPVDRIGIHLELRARLDSIELEKQVRKRQGKPIEDLEAMGEVIRDSLLGMRDAVAGAYRDNPQAFGVEEKGFSFSLTGLFANLPDVILTFRPEGVFDWVIVVTGFVAVLSLVMLFFGILAGRRKRRGERGEARRGKKKVVVRKMDLKAADGGQRPAERVGDLGGGGGSGNAGSVNDGGDNLMSLMEHLRKLTPQSELSAQPRSAPLAGDELPPMPAPPFQPPAQSAYQPPQVAPPPPRPKPPPEPSAPPPPLFVNVPDPPPVPAPDRAAAEAMSINELVMSATNSGMSEQEISRRYQLSVDQVRLILRMNQP